LDVAIAEERQLNVALRGCPVAVTGETRSGASGKAIVTGFAARYRDTAKAVLDPPGAPVEVPQTTIFPSGSTPTPQATSSVLSEPVM